MEFLRICFLITAILSHVVAAENEAQPDEKMCVVRIVEGRHFFPENSPAFFRIIVEGIGADLISVTAKMDGKRAVLPSDRHECFKILSDLLRKEGLSIQPDDADKFGKKVETGGTIDFAIISLLRLSGWVLRSSGKVYETPSTFTAERVGERELSIRPDSVYSVSEFYFELVQREE